jgi:U4/U6.U5 tri-snRNP-associated protein 1
MEVSVSLEETNKIRISLGLKPLTDDTTPADDKEKQAEANYAKQREAEAKERDTKYVLVTFYLVVELMVFSAL